jgi:Fe-S-cluster-containing hydrogenase component 2
MSKILKFYPERCNGCLICEKACSKVLFKTEEGGESSALHIRRKDDVFEMVVCDQCGLCIDMCLLGALSRNKNGLVILDRRQCVGCQACVAFCPTDAMMNSPMRIEPFKCLSCGACVRACPEHALELIEEKVSKLKVIVYNQLGV